MLIAPRPHKSTRVSYLRLPPWLTTQIGKAKPAPQTAYAVVVDAPQAQGQGASSVASKPPPPPPAGFVGTFNGPVAVVVGQPLL